MKIIFVSVIIIASISKLCAQHVGIGTVSPVARLHVADSNVIFTGPSTVSASTNYKPPVQGAGTRMMWYPQKAAFRAGGVDGTQWNKDSIGLYSFASGFGSKAKGFASAAIGDYTTALTQGSVALGSFSTASGGYSIAMGESTTASGAFSTASGFLSTASGVASTSMGRSTNASGDSSTALGSHTIASGNSSTALGYYTNASGQNSLATGSLTTASGISSTAMGLSSSASGYVSAALGYQTNASGTISTAMGQFTIASGDRSTAMGDGTLASGSRSTAIGHYTVASGDYSTSLGTYTSASSMAALAMGLQSAASGNYSVATGNTTIASGTGSFTMGENTIAQAANSVATGLSTKAKNNEALIAGRYNDTTATNSLFEIGNGTGINNRSNAITVLSNGNIGLGTTTPGRRLTFSSVTEEKIQFYQSPAGEYGIGLHPFELRLHCDLSGSKISFGTQSITGVFAELGKFQQTGNYAMNVYGYLMVNGVTYTSDQRFKKNITSIHSPLQKLLQINGVEYEMQTDEFPQYRFTKGRQIGLLAQNVEIIIPEAVHEADGYKGVDYARLVPLLVESIKEQQKQIESLKQTIQKLLDK